MFGSKMSGTNRPSNAQRKMSYSILGPLVVVLILSQTACSPLFTASANSESPKSLVELQAEVNTAVAATMVGFYVEETQSAAKLASSPVAPTEVPPTPTPSAVPVEPSPTAIPVQPTVESPPTLLPAPVIVTLAPVAPEVSSALPTIWAEVNTNCRYGPSINYYVVGYLTVGITSSVYGSDSGKDWWYIENPQRKGAFCWVWSQPTHVEGNLAAIPVVATTVQVGPVYSPYYGYNYNSTCGYGYNCGYNYNYNYTYNPCANYNNWNCYCPCETKKLTCNQKKKWCTPVNLCKCKKVCYNPCFQSSCYYPYNQVDWEDYPQWKCNDTVCKKIPESW